MRNLTPVTILTARLRGSQFDREVLGVGIYPTALTLHPDHCLLEWHYTNQARRGLEVVFYLILKGKSKGWAMASPGSPTEALEEHQFVSRLLGQHLLGEELLLKRAYDYDRLTLENTFGQLYDL